MTEHWSSVEEVAKYLGVAQRSIYRRIEGRGLAAAKTGRPWKVKLSEADVWVGAGEAKGREKVTATSTASNSNRGCP